MGGKFSCRGKRVTVYGLGIAGGGVGTVEFLAKSGAKEIIVTDAKGEAELADSVEKIRNLPGVFLSLGSQRKEDFTEVDLVVKNPRIPWTDACIEAAFAANVPVEMDSSIFFSICDKPIIGVTGTKGKTTTSVAVAHILREGGKRVLEVGIGEIPVLSRIDEIPDADIVVFELSSWRLSALANARKSPHIAVFTNLYPDHLNYYSSMEEYFSDKKNIVRFQNSEDIFVFNANSIEVSQLAKQVASKTIACSSEDTGTDGVFLKDGSVILRELGKETSLVLARDIRPIGSHILLDILLAVAVARASDVSCDDISRGIRSFSGVPHRLEFIAEKEGVLWYNDTAATVPDAAISAIHSFEKPIVILAGGSDKNLRFEHLSRAISDAPHVLGVILFEGDATEKIDRLLRLDGGSEKVLGKVSSMKDAISLARRFAPSGSVVLLSPGAASFGLFQNEFDRGNQFRDQVLSL